jgi:hypothetical protein
MRPNAHLYVRPDVWRFMPPGAPKYLGKNAVRYFWPKKERAQPSRRDDRALQVEAEELHGEREVLLDLRAELLAVKADIRWRRFVRVFKYNFNPTQRRVPAGSLGAGEWAGGGGASGGPPPSGTALDSEIRVAQASSFGTYAGESLSPIAGQKDCYYAFSFGIVAVPWSLRLACMPKLHWSAATHGRLLK